MTNNDSVISISDSDADTSDLFHSIKNDVDRANDTQTPPGSLSLLRNTSIFQSCKLFSPEPNPLPDIVIVPPSTDRKRVRRSKRTPTKTLRISMNSSRIRRTAAHLRTVLERGKEEEEKSENIFNDKVAEEKVQDTPKNKSREEEDKKGLLSWPSIIVVISPGEEIQ